MDTVRRSALDDETLENMESALKDALSAVRAGQLKVDDALGDILYLISSIDHGEPSEIKTWTTPGALTQKITRVDNVDQWNAAHPIGSRFLSELYPDLVLESRAPAFIVEGQGAAVECRIPGQGVGGGILIKDLICVDGLKSASSRLTD
jgi:hypothetical protein